MSRAGALKVHSGQATVLNAKQRFRVVVAGRRWGKTRCALAALLQFSAIPKQLIWYVAPTYRMARGIMWYELIASIPRKLIIDINETLLRIRLINGTTLELKGADKPDTLRGVGLHFLVLDEAQDIKEETWDKVLRPTLVTTRGHALIIGTPKSFNWLHRVYVEGQKGENYLTKAGRKVINAWQSWQFPTSMSPFVPAEEIEAARADLDPKSFQQEFEASFVTMSGRVYYAFDRTIHVGDYPFNPRLPIWIGQDFNIDPMSSVIMQEQPNGDVWIVDELVMFGSNTQETADALSAKYVRYLKGDGITFYPDPAGANRAHTRGESDVQILREAGFRRIVHRRKHPKVADRVNAVNRRLLSADGTVRTYVDRHCKHTIIGFEQTMYKPGTREVDKRDGVEHPIDAVGYCFDIRYPVRDRYIAAASF